MSDYTPREGSLAALVIAHLQEHGGQLSAAQANELGGGKTNASTLLRPAADAGLLVRVQAGRGFAWELPPPPKATGGPLTIVTFSDGDVAVSGHQESVDGSALFTREQLLQLFSHVTRPHLRLPAPADQLAG